MRYCDILLTDKLIMCEGRYGKYRGDEEGTIIVYSSDEYKNANETAYQRVYKNNHVRHLNGDIAFTRKVDDEDQIVSFYCIIRNDNPIISMIKHFKNIKNNN